jgi:hypothetical protein
MWWNVCQGAADFGALGGIAMKTALTLTLSITLAGSLVACGGNPPGPSEGEEGASSMEAAAAAPPFFDKRSGKSATFAGLHGEEYQIDKQLQTQVDVLDSNAGYGCFYAMAGSVAPADLARAMGDQKQLTALLAAVESGGADTASDLPLVTVARGALFSDVLQEQAFGSTTEERKRRANFIPSLRTVVRSMISTPGAQVFHLTIDGDATDEAFIAADPTTGEIKVLVQGGDC